MADLKDSNNGTKKTQESQTGTGGGNKYLEKVVDDLVSLNGLFTVAVFMGLSFANPGTIHSLEDRPECDPDVEMRKRIVQFEIASFSCFLFSGKFEFISIVTYIQSLILSRSSGFLAKTVKIFFYIYQTQVGEDPPVKAQKDIRVLSAFYLSIYGTMIGCACLLIAMVDVVQMKLGKLSCNSIYTLRTVLVLCILIVVGIGTYFTAVTYGAKLEFEHWRKTKRQENVELLTDTQI